MKSIIGVLLLKKIAFSVHDTYENMTAENMNAYQRAKAKRSYIIITILKTSIYENYFVKLSSSVPLF